MKNFVLIQSLTIDAQYLARESDQHSTFTNIDRVMTVPQCTDDESCL